MTRLHFALADCRVWLDDQRMQLIHISAAGVTRHEIIEGPGIKRARPAHAHWLRLGRPHLHRHPGLIETLAVEPQLHALEGIVHVDPPVRLEIEVERGHYLCAFNWRDSPEDGEHIRACGISTVRAC